METHEDVSMPLYVIYVGNKVVKYDGYIMQHLLVLPPLLLHTLLVHTTISITEIHLLQLNEIMFDILSKKILSF